VSERLTDLLSEQRVDVAVAQTLATPQDVAIIDALMAGELDIR
jgi:hypothetical protein